MLRIGLLDLVILQKCLSEAKQIYIRQFNIVLDTVKAERYKGWF